MEGFITIVFIVFISFILFVIYFNFKIIQFVIQAVNLYKKMIVRQDATLNLLMDIRDNTKKFDNRLLKEADTEIDSEPKIELKTCSKCHSEIPVMYKRCPKCGNKFE